MARRRQMAAGARVSRRAQSWDLFLLCAAGLILVSVARVHAFFSILSAIRPGLILSAIGLGCLIAGQKGPRRLRYLKSPLGYTMGFFLAWAIIGVPLSIYGARSLSFLTDEFLRNALVIIVIICAVRDLTDLKRLLGVYAGGVIAFALLATGTRARHVGGGGYDANDSAMLLVSAIPLIFYFMVRARTTMQKALFGFGLAACGSSVVVAGSRGGFLGLVAVMGYSLFFFKGIKPSWRVAVVAVAGVVVISQADAGFWTRMKSITDENDYNRTSYTGRQAVWTRGIGYMMQHPIFGVGIDDFNVAEGRNPLAVAAMDAGRGYKFSAAHSIWVQTGAEMGIPGLLTLIRMLWLAIAELWAADRPKRGRLKFRDPELERLGELGRPLIGVLIGAIVAGTFLSRAYSPLLWMPLGLTLIFVKLRNMREAELRRAAGAIPGRPSGRPALRQPVSPPLGAGTPHGHSVPHAGGEGLSAAGDIVATQG